MFLICITMREPANINYGYVSHLQETANPRMIKTKFVCRLPMEMDGYGC